MFGILKFILKFGKIALKIIKILYKLGFVNDENLSRLGIDIDDIGLDFSF
jgi:hypothetical protein